MIGAFALGNMIRHLLAVGAFAFGNTSVTIRRTLAFGNTSAIIRRTVAFHASTAASGKQKRLKHGLASRGFVCGAAALMRRVRVLHSFRDHNFTADQ